MFDYEEDYEEYYEPSEIEVALEEFKDGIYKMLNKDVAQQIKEKDAKIVELKNELAERKKKYDEVCNDKQSAVKQAEEETRKEIKVKYYGAISVGDTVYTLKNDRHESECEHCEDGKIKTKSGTIKCPECNGTGIKRKWKLGVKETKVRKISAHAIDEGYGFKKDGIYYYVPGDDNHVTIYATLEEAEKALDKKR